MNGTHRKDIKVGLEVLFVEKQNQRSGELTRGIVARILTNSQFHPHGIKIMTDEGVVGRVKEIIQDN